MSALIVTCECEAMSEQAYYTPPIIAPTTEQRQLLLSVCCQLPAGIVSPPHYNLHNSPCASLCQTFAVTVERCETCLVVAVFRCFKLSRGLSFRCHGVYGEAPTISEHHCLNPGIRCNRRLTQVVIYAVNVHSVDYFLNKVCV